MFNHKNPLLKNQEGKSIAMKNKKFVLKIRLFLFLVAFFKFVDPSGSIHQHFLTGKKRM